MPHLLIDGYNLLYVLAKGPILSLQKSREALLTQLNRYQGLKPGVEICVVFDSTYENHVDFQRDKFGAIEIVYTRSNQSADDYIHEECSKHPSHYVVVSNDHQVQLSAENFSSLAISADEFARKLPNKNEVTAKENPYLEDKEDKGPLYPKVSTKKKGSSKKLPKRERRKANQLKNL